YEKDPKLRKLYLDGLHFTWKQVRRNLNPLWNYISAASSAGPLSSAFREDSQRTLERIPVDQIEWTTRNSHRIDVRFRKQQDRFNGSELRDVLAPDERPVEKWNSNPFRPDGGADGRGEDDGAYYLLPYWMGRYYKWVE